MDSKPLHTNGQHVRTYVNSAPPRLQETHIKNKQGHTAVTCSAIFLLARPSTKTRKNTPCSERSHPHPLLTCTHSVLPYLRFSFFSRRADGRTVTGPKFSKKHPFRIIASSRSIVYHSFNGGNLFHPIRGLLAVVGVEPAPLPCRRVLPACRRDAPTSGTVGVSIASALVVKAVGKTVQCPIRNSRRCVLYVARKKKEKKGNQQLN